MNLAELEPEHLAQAVLEALGRPSVLEAVAAAARERALGYDEVRARARARARARVRVRPNLNPDPNPDPDPDPNQAACGQKLLLALQGTAAA